MKQTTKRLVSSFLTLTMLASIAGTSVFAVDVDASEENASVLVVDETTPQTGDSAAAFMEGDVAVASEESGTLPTYKEGTFSGTGTGYGGPITITVQMAKGENDVVAIQDIQAEQEKETPSYWEKAVVILDQIKAANTTEGVDTVSGATMSCDGILEGAQEALTKARADFVFDGGQGTKTKPYLVESADTLQGLSASVAAGETYEGQYIALGADIDLSGVDYTPIGSKDAAFSGTFDGKGYTISNMTIGTAEAPTTAAYTGLFGYVNRNAEICNVNLTKVSIVSAATAANYNGALIGFSKNKTSSDPAEGAIVDNCHVSGSIVVNTNGEAITMTGGLIGMSNQFSQTTNSSADVDIIANTGEKNGNVGGLIGFSSINGLVMNCLAAGDVSLDSASTGSNNVGGVFGGANGVVYNNVVSGAVSAAQEDTSVGAIAGSASATTMLSECYFDSDKTAKNIGDNSAVEGSNAAVGKTTGELAAAATAEQLNGNLSKKSRTAFVAEAEEKAPEKADWEQAKNTVSEQDCYEWTVADGALAISDTLYANANVDSDIFASGSGTAEDPYIISTEEQLRNFATSLTDKLDYTGTYIALGNDIALSSKMWMPVGSGDNAFNGSFDGRGYSITGLTIGSEKEPYQDSDNDDDAIGYFGLFGVLNSDAQVSNLKLDVSIYTSAPTSNFTGGLAGYVSESLIDSVTVTGTVHGITTHDSANTFIGGVVGYGLRHKIVNTHVNADVRAESVGGIAEAGGIIALQNRGLVANSYVEGSISGTSDRSEEGAPSLGGIAAVHAGTIENCYSTATVVSDCYTSYVGALAGWATGIADSFQCYFSEDTKLVTDDKTDDRLEIVPAVGIGWSVGPGVNDEGVPFTGSVALDVTALKAGEMTDGTLTKKLNDNLSALNVDLAAGGRQERQWTGSDDLASSLKSWQAGTDAAPAVLTDSTVKAVYDKSTTEKINALLPEVDESYKEGTYYGRDSEKNTIVRVDINKDGAISAVSVEKGDNKYEDECKKLADGSLTADKLDDSTFKSAVQVALEKAINGDTSIYGEATNDLFASGDGSENNPWTIQTEAQLRAFAAHVNEDESYQNKYVALENDIALTKEWIPAGGQTPFAFAGHFDGKGHTISNMTIGSEKAPYAGYYAGLFAYIEGGTVTNLSIEKAAIYAAATNSKRVYGAILAAAMEQSGLDGYVDNVSTSGTISVHSNSGAAYGAGLLGQSNRGSVTNCSSQVEMQVTSDARAAYAAGLIGVPARTAILNSYARGNVSIDAQVNQAAIGGLFGFQAGVSYNCYADVNLESKASTTDIGGLAGRLTGIATMQNSYFAANATQKHGSVTFADGEKKAVGVAVDGSTMEGLAAATDLSSQKFADTLNENLKNTAALDAIAKMMEESWSAPLNKNLKLNAWTTAEGSTVTFEKHAHSWTEKVTKKARRTKNGEMTLTCKTCGETKTEIIPKVSTIELKTDAYTYSGKAKNPKVIVKDAEGTALVSGTDYTAKLAKGRTNVGKYSVKVTLAGKKYSGSKTLTFIISPRSTSISKASGVSKGITVSWSKRAAQTTGYQVQYATSKSFRNAARTTIKSNKTTSATLKKLKANKKYYVRVRTYKTVEGKKYYSDWSKTKTVTTKK